jgi:Carboxypeptidase regulatory-like domain
MRHFWRVVCIPICLVVGTLSAYAQFSSGIEGTAKDSTGAIVPGATVTLNDTRTGVTKTATTNQNGDFRFDGLGTSTYTVGIQQSGFESWHENNIILQPGEIRTLAPVLQVGAVSASVEVSAEAAALNLTNPATGAVITDTTLQQTPLVGQNVYSLATLSPGLTGNAVTNIDNYSNAFTININAAGLRQEQNGYQIDDAYVNEPSRGGGSTISPIPDTVQSMDIKTNDFDAQKGRNAGATVDIYTIAGSNNFHGTVNYYFLNNSLSARTEFQSSLPSYQRNEVGGTFGGPILKNKLFFFGAVDVLRSSSTSSGSGVFETPDFVSYAKANYPNSVATQILTMAPPIVAPTSDLQSVSQYEAATPGYFAPPAGIPSTLNIVGTANYSFAVPRNGYQWSFRVDDYIGANDRVYVDVQRLSLTTGNYGNRPALNIPSKSLSDFVNMNWTHTFSSHLLNQAGADLIRPQGASQAVPALAIPYVNVTGLQGFGSWGPGNYIQTTLGWHDVMTATVARHTLKFGADFYNIREVDAQTGAIDRPTYNFNSLLDFVQDKPLTESATPVDLLTHLQAPYSRRYRELYQGYFLQDDWKLTPRFTLNAGLRYDEMVNLFSIYSPQLTNFTLGQGATTEDQIAAGAVGLTGTPHILNHNVWAFTPRLGFSWDLFGNGRTAIRGGIGMFADQPPYLHMTDITAGNPPNTYTPSIDVRSGGQPDFQLCSPPTGFSIVCPIVDTSNVVVNSAGGVVANGVVQRSNIGGYNTHYKMGQVYDWTISVQQQLQKNLIVELNYSASAAHHLPVYNQDLNRFAGDLIVNNGSLQRLNGNFGTLPYATSDGNSVGNYGSALLTRTLSHGVAVRGVYTWGKALDVPLSNSASIDSGSIVSTTQNGPIFQNLNSRAQRGRSDYDIRQQFAANGTWTVPSNYSSALERNLLGGWQFGGILLLQTGLPFTVYNNASFSPVCSGGVSPVSGGCPAGSTIVGNSGGDYNADGSDVDLPNVPAFGRHLTGQHKSNFLNGLFPGGASAFPAPALGTEGTLGRNTYDHLGYNNFDLNFEKFFSTPWFFGEKLKFEAKGEVINLFNRVNLTTVSNTFPSSNFGKATGQLTPRYLQLHLRASF